MGDRRHEATASTRFGLRSGGGGEIVEVQGGHIVRSTGRKDRHSKICTAKGPRDRRVRLSAHTAIQFYDVQDRLGYDRPSKAVDWLIKKAKTAIDELAELPAWDPHATNAGSQQQQPPQMNQGNDDQIGVHHHTSVGTVVSANRRASTTMVGSHVGSRLSDCTLRNLQRRLNENTNNSTSSFLPPSLESDSIVDTIKSFFPMGATAETPPSTMQFQTFLPDLLSRTSSQNQDLRLSLQSFQDPVLLHHHQQAQHQVQTQNQTEHVLFSETDQLGFDGSSTGWSEQSHPVEPGRVQRTVTWNSGAADAGSSGNGTTAGSGGGGIFLFNSPPPTQAQSLPPLQPFFCQNQFLSQRGPLQSSNPPVRAWIDPSMAAVTAAVTNYHHHYNHLPKNIHQFPFSGLGFTSGGFSGFQIPARIQGDEEHDGISAKPSSASSDSRH